MEDRKKRTREEIIYHAIVCPIFIFFVLICAYPFYYLVIATISNAKQVDLGNVIWKPIGIHFTNYIKIFNIQGLADAATISVLRVGVGTACTLFTNSYLAYFFTKEKMWGRKFWYRMVVITMYFSAGLIPIYLNIRALGLLNNFWVYILPGMVSVYNMILIKTSIEALPADLEESAYLDGAGYLTRFLRIVLPLQKPILATTGLFTAVSEWNDFFSTKLYVTKPKLYTLQFKLYEMLSQISAAAAQMELEGAEEVDAITSTGIRMTLTVVVTVPIMLVYPFIQRHYVKGIMIGAVKG